MPRKGKTLAAKVMGELLKKLRFFDKTTSDHSLNRSDVVVKISDRAIEIGNLYTELSNFTKGSCHGNNLPRAT